MGMTMSISITYSRVRACACARIRAIAPPDSRNGRYTPTQGPTGIIYHPEHTKAVQTPSHSSEAAIRQYLTPPDVEITSKMQF